MREQVAGYSDEATEDVTFRRLMSPYSASRDLLGEQQPQLDPEDAAGPSQQQSAADIALPGRVRRVTVTTAAGGAGLALGAGLIKLAHILGKLRRKGKPKRRAAQQQAGGSRRQPQAGAAGKGRSTPKPTPRTTPRKR